MSAVASIRDRWPELPDDGAEVDWEPLADDSITEDEAASARLLVAALDITCDVSAAAGRPNHLITVAAFGEMYLAVVWRGLSDACWFRGVPRRPLDQCRSDGDV